MKTSWNNLSAAQIHIFIFLNLQHHVLKATDGHRHTQKKSQKAGAVKRLFGTHKHTSVQVWISHPGGNLPPLSSFNRVPLKSWYLTGGGALHPASHTVLCCLMCVLVSSHGKCYIGS